MGDSMGASPDGAALPEHREDIFANLAFCLTASYIAFFYNILLILPKVYTKVLAIDDADSGAFQANILAVSILFFTLGFVLGYLLCPLSTTHLYYITLASMVLVIALAFLPVVDPRAAFYAYILLTAGLSAALGAMDVIGFGAAHDRTMRGDYTERIMSFLCGHPFGFFLSLCIALGLESRRMGVGADGALKVATLYGVSSIAVIMLFGIPAMYFMMSHLSNAGAREERVMGTNFLNGTFFYDRGLHSLSKCTHSLVILFVMESLEGIMNGATRKLRSRSDILLMDPFPVLQSYDLSMLCVMLQALCDILGRVAVPLFKKMLNHTEYVRKNMNNTMKRDLGADGEAEAPAEKAASGEAPSAGAPAAAGAAGDPAESEVETDDELDAAERGETDRVELKFVTETEDEKVRKHNQKYAGALPWVWLVVLFRAITGGCYLLARHYPEDYAFINLETLANLLMHSGLNAAFRGIVFAFVFSSIYSVIYVELLDEQGVTLEATPGEASGCVDARVNASVSAAIAVSSVAVIWQILFNLLIYVGYKYHRLLYEAEVLNYEEHLWVTDHIGGSFCKFWWWVRNVFGLILRDFRDPFGLRQS